jgi:hypothetical protein
LKKKIGAKHVVQAIESGKTLALNKELATNTYFVLIPTSLESANMAIMKVLTESSIS